jgi:micrococcal nuclease
MGAEGRGRSWLGSTVALVVAAALILRPWEGGLLPGAEEPRSARVTVTRVVDGDTIEVLLDGRREDVRYIGVDTPETVKPDTPVQCFGPQASAFNHALVEGREVRLVFGAERRDIYGRLLAYVYLGDRLVNATLVRRGLAQTLTIPPNDRLAARFERLQMRAARAGRGLWDACGS